MAESSMIQLQIGRSETDELLQLLQKLVVPGKKTSNQASKLFERK
jgi:hypothetical protein